MFPQSRRLRLATGSNAHCKSTPGHGGGGHSSARWDGSIELHGRVRDVETRTATSEVARGVRGTVPIRNRLGTEESTESQVSAIGYGYAWLHTLMERATGLDLEESQIARIEEFAEQKLVDLFDVAEDVAAANGRSRLLRQDLPVTKGLQLILMEVTDLAHEFKLEPLLLFLSDAGVRAPIDEGVHSDVPRLLAGLLVLCGRIIDVVEPAAQRSEAGRPSSTAVTRAQAVVDLVL